MAKQETLQIEPIIQFQHDGAVLDADAGHVVVVGQYKVKVTHRLEAPLQPCIDVEILRLRIKLKESREKQASRK